MSEGEQRATGMERVRRVWWKINNQQVDASAIPDFGTHTVVLWEAMQHCAALHSVPQRESEGPPSDSAVKRP